MDLMSDQATLTPINSRSISLIMSATALNEASEEIISLMNESVFSVFISVCFLFVYAKVHTV